MERTHENLGTKVNQAHLFPMGGLELPFSSGDSAYVPAEAIIPIFEPGGSAYRSPGADGAITYSLIEPWERDVHPMYRDRDKRENEALERKENRRRRNMTYEEREEEDREKNAREIERREEKERKYGGYKP